MSARSVSLARQRGVAVITALLLTTLCITIVSSLFWQQQVQVRSIENQRLQSQNQWLLRGALDWARLILREDGRISNEDTLDEPWAVPLSETRIDQYVENNRADTDASDATLSGSIADAQSHYNLTNLSTNGVINPREIAVFERLLTNLRLNPALAKATADMMRASQPKPAAPRQASEQKTEGSQPMALTQIDDLLAVPGFTNADLDKLRDFVVVLPGATAINVNTAPVEVLAAIAPTMSMTDATTLVASRKTASFRDLNDLAQRLPGKFTGDQDTQLAVASNYFLVNGKVNMSRAGLSVQALIRRDRTITRLIWIREN
ncbi:MAG: type II secretion system minor pseudopilin GspK [Pseudomonadota bacterium]